MNNDNGFQDLTEFDIFEDVEYELENTQISSVVSSWVIRYWDELQGQFLISERELSQSAESGKGIGNPLDVKAFHIEESEVKAAIDLILEIYLRRNVFFTVPAEINPLPGKRIDFTDTLPVNDIDVEARILTMSYNFDEDSIALQGKFTF